MADCMTTGSRIQELANNFEKKKSRNKEHAKIKWFTVCEIELLGKSFLFACFNDTFNKLRLIQAGK